MREKIEAERKKINNDRLSWCSMANNENEDEQQDDYAGLKDWKLRVSGKLTSGIGGRRSTYYTC